MNKIHQIFLAVALLISTQLIAQEQDNTPYIEIESQVERKVVPDRIYLNLLVKATKTRSIDKIERQVISKLAKVGIPEERIFLQDAASDLVNIWYKKKRIEDQKQYQILVYNTKELGNCMETLDIEGVENIHISHTEYSKKEELKLDMLAEAMKKAKQKGQVMLSAIDKELGSPLIIRENRVFARKMEVYNQAVRANGLNEETEEPNINFKKQNYQIQVYVRFEINSTK